MRKGRCSGRWITEKGLLWADKLIAVGCWITEKGPLWADKLIAVGLWIPFLTNKRTWNEASTAFIYVHAH